MKELNIRNLKGYKDASSRFIKALSSNIKQMSDYVNNLLTSLPSDKFNVFYYTQIKNQLDEYSKILGDKIEKDYEETLNQLQTAAMDKLGKNIDTAGIKGYMTPFLSPEMIKEFSSISAEYVKNIPNEIQNEIEKTLRISALSGDTVFDIQKKLGGKLEGYKGVFKTGENRAKAIAMNELSRAYSNMDWQQIQELGSRLEGVAQVYKVWHSNKDERVRPAHLEADGQEVLWNEPFIVNGEELMYPMDPNGSPGNTINCRCWMTVKIVPIEEEKDSFIDKMSDEEIITSFMKMDLFDLLDNSYRAYQNDIIFKDLPSSLKSIFFNLKTEYPKFLRKCLKGSGFEDAKEVKSFLKILYRTSMENESASSYGDRAFEKYFDSNTDLIKKLKNFTWNALKELGLVQNEKITLYRGVNKGALYESGPEGEEQLKAEYTPCNKYFESWSISKKVASTYSSGYILTKQFTKDEILLVPDFVSFASFYNQEIVISAKTMKIKGLKGDMFHLE